MRERMAKSGRPYGTTGKLCLYNTAAPDNLLHSLDDHVVQRDIPHFRRRSVFKYCLGLQQRDFQANAVSWPQHYPPHLEILWILNT